MNIQTALSYYNKSKNISLGKSLHTNLTTESSLQEWISAQYYCQNDKLMTSFLGIPMRCNTSIEMNVKTAIDDFMTTRFGLTHDDFEIKNNVIHHKKVTIPWSYSRAQLLYTLPDMLLDYVTWTDIDNKEAIAFFAQHDIARLMRWHQNKTINILPHLPMCLELCLDDIRQQHDKHPLVSLIDINGEPLPLKIATLLQPEVQYTHYLMISGDEEMERQYRLFPESYQENMDFFYDKILSHLKYHSYNYQGMFSHYHIIMLNRDLHWIRKEPVSHYNQTIIENDSLITYLTQEVIDEDIMFATLTDMPCSCVEQFLNKHPEYLKHDFFKKHKEELLFLSSFPDIPFYALRRHLNHLSQQAIPQEETLFLG